MTAKVLITGVGGQDGTYLARRLIADGYRVTGTVQPGSHFNSDLAAIDGLELRTVELSDAEASSRIVHVLEPDFVFHFAGISSVAYSWDEPLETAAVNGISVVAILDAIQELQEKTGRRRVLVNASSAEIFAGSSVSPQNELTPVSPTSPYGATKAFSHHMVQVYRSRGVHASNAIFYNHESPLRPQRFVTRKITAGVAAIRAGHQKTLELGNLDARRDWGWAPDYVDAAYRMSQQEVAGDYVVATGEAHSVREFVDTAFRAAGIEDWDGLVTSAESLHRPADSAEMVGDASKAAHELGWSPTKRFHDVVEAMVEHDLALLEGKILR